MPDPTNLISAELSDQDQAESLSFIDSLRAKLPFLTKVTDKEKRYLLYPGVRGMEAAEEMARVVEKYADQFPKMVTDALPELRRDLLLARSLRPIVKALQVITSIAEDTLHAARSDAFRSSLIAFSFGKSMGKTIPGLTKDLQTLVAYFDRPKRRGTSDPSDADA
jgi:hypothetical protein